MSKLVCLVSHVSAIVLVLVGWPSGTMGAPVLNPVAYLPYVAKNAAVAAPYVPSNYSTYIDAQGRRHIVGEVFNPNNSPLSEIYVSVAGEQTALAYPFIESVQPQQAGCFNSPIDNGVTPIPQVASYSVDGWTLPPLTVSSNGAYDAATERYNVSGQIANVAGGTMKTAVLVATAYDSSGTVIGCTFGLTQLDAENPVGFGLDFSDHDYAAVSRYVLMVSSFPW